jgi:hypothetical protein
MRSRRWKVTIGLAVALGMVALPAAAGVGPAPRTAPVRISGPGATGVDTRPAVAIDPIGHEALVVWADYRSGESEIWGSFVDTLTGSVVGSDFLISPPGSTPGYGPQFEPSVAYSHDADRYLVVWTHDQITTGYDVLGQRVNGDGSLHGSVLCVACSAILYEWSPDVAYSQHRKQFLVVWVDDLNASYDIRGLRIRPNGNTLGSEIQISSSAGGSTGHDNSPALAYNTIKRQYQVVWTDGRNGSWNGDIYAQRIRDNGNLIGPPFAVCVDPAGQASPDVAFDALEYEYYVVWTDERRKSIDIYGQLTSSYGRLRGGQRRIGLGGGDDWSPAVSRNILGGDPTARYLVVWSDGRNDPDTDIRGRYIDNRVQPQGSADFVIEGSTASQWFPAVPRISDLVGGEWLIVWRDDRGTSDDIWGMMFP